MKNEGKKWYSLEDGENIRFLRENIYPCKNLVPEDRTERKKLDTSSGSESPVRKGGVGPGDGQRGAKTSRDGNLWVVVIVKSCVNKQAGSGSAAQEWTTNQKPGQQGGTTLDFDTNS